MGKSVSSSHSFFLFIYWAIKKFNLWQFNFEIPSGVEHPKCNLWGDVKIQFIFSGFRWSHCTALHNKTYSSGSLTLWYTIRWQLLHLEHVSLIFRRVYSYVLASMPGMVETATRGGMQRAKLSLRCRPIFKGFQFKWTYMLAVCEWVCGCDVCMCATFGVVLVLLVGSMLN